MKRTSLLINFLYFVNITLSFSYTTIEDDIQYPQNKLQITHAQHVDTGLTEATDDGPYIFIDENNQGVSISIVEGKVVNKKIELSVVEFDDEPAIYKEVTKIAVLSDIHGQLDVLLHVLKAHGIIDVNNKWSYDSGHFVIVGDIFDRGPQVTETLWFVFELEKQARAAGGKVHYLLGNHEYMVLHKDLRYLHDKYLETSRLLETDYNELYNTETLLGRWLRAKATTIKINDILFVHGGLSPEYIDLKLSLEETNNLFRKSIDIPKEEIKQHETYSALYSRTGPIWFRGYFIDAIPKTDVESILTHFNSTNIVVGHTSCNKIKAAFGGLVFVVDSSIKNGKTGEVLFIENNVIYRGKANGKRVRLSQTL